MFQRTALPCTKYVFLKGLLNKISTIHAQKCELVLKLQVISRTANNSCRVKIQFATVLIWLQSRMTLNIFHHLFEQIISRASNEAPYHFRAALKLLPKTLEMYLHVAAPPHIVMRCHIRRNSPKMQHNWLAF